MLLSICGLLACLMLTTPVGAQQNPPDQVDPPAEGEGQPLDDPSEPETEEYSAMAQPTASISLSGAAWRAPSLKTLGASDRYRRGIALSREMFPNGTRRVVLVGGQRYAEAMGASALAAAAGGPLLMTPATSLTSALTTELRRLDPEVVLLVGPLREKIVRQVRALGARPRRLLGADRYATADLVARRVNAFAPRSTSAIVASGESFTHNRAVAAFAAGRRLPVLLAPANTGNMRLRQMARDLGIRRTFVIGGRAVISDRVVQGLPQVHRLGGASPTATAATVARRAQALGMTGQPILVDHTAPEHAILAGAAYGRRGSVLFTTAGRQLAAPAQNYLDDRSPRSMTLVADGLASVTRCQVRQGRERSWFCAEQELRRQGYHMPQVDGRSDRFSIWAIYAFEKVAGRRANGSFGEAEWVRMLRNPRRPVRRPDLPSTHVEIDIGRQLILLVKNGRVRHQLHTSTGKPSTPTVRGTFTVYEKRPYMQANHMYKSIFFHGGYAIHGYPSIPTYPASHGCARTYNGNMDFIYPKVFMGERVATY